MPEESEVLPEGPEGLPQGPEGIPEGPEGLQEGAESLPEGPKGLPGRPGGQTYRWTEFLPFLQDFVPCQGPLPKNSNFFLLCFGKVWGQFFAI